MLDSAAGTFLMNEGNGAGSELLYVGCETGETYGLLLGWGSVVPIENG